MYHVYIIQSQKDSSYYVGYTSELQLRIKKHNAGNSRYTSKKTPWVLVYSEAFESKSEAIRREKEIKKQKSKIYIENLIKSRVSR